MSFHHLSPTDFRDEYLQANYGKKIEMQKWASERGGEYLDALHEAMEIEYDKLQRWVSTGGRGQMEEMAARQKAERRQKIKAGEMPLEKSARAVRRTAERLEMLAESDAPTCLMVHSFHDIKSRMEELSLNASLTLDIESYE